MPYLPASIEPLETRIAPAGLVTLIDVDGDIITVATSLGTSALLTSAIAKTALGVTGGERIDLITLTDPIFDGTSLSVTARPGPLGGDGLVNVTAIDATGQNITTIKVAGDVQDIDAGKGVGGLKIQSIDVFSTSGTSVWNIKADLGVLNVRTNLAGAEIHLDFATYHLGLLSIGQSLIGGAGLRTGHVDVAGTITTVKIGRDIVGGGGAKSGYIEAAAIGTATIGGSIRGGNGAGTDSGEIVVTGSLGSLKLGGSIFGGAAADSGAVRAGSIGVVNIAGSIIGGGAANTGSLKSSGAFGAVTILGNIQGGTAADSGQILGAGKLGSLLIGQSVLGGQAERTGRVFIDVPTGDAPATTLGLVTIRGNVESSTFADTGTVRFVSGAHNDQVLLKSLAGISIGGSIVGGGMVDGFQVMLDGNTTAIRVVGDVLGGAASGAGSIRSSGNVGSYFIGGSLVGKSGSFSGSAGAFKNIGTAFIGGDVHGGSESFSGAFGSILGSIGSLTVRGSLLGGGGPSSGTLEADFMGAVVVKGSIVGSAASPYSIFVNGLPPNLIGPKIALRSLTVGGSVQDSVILASGSGDVQIGAVTVVGDWIASSISAGVTPTDAFFGDANDAPFNVGDPSLFSKIASITIGGQVRGTTGAGDTFGFVAQEIGAVRIHGVAVKLHAGRNNDTDLSTGGLLSLGAFRDVFIHEVPS